MTNAHAKPTLPFVLTATLVVTVSATWAFAQAAKKPKFTGAPAADLSKPILWGSECQPPDGQALRFCGIDQAADDGAVHTQIQVDGQWKPIIDDLRKANPLEETRDGILTLRGRVKDAAADARYVFFEGKAADERLKPIVASVAAIAKDVQTLVKKMGPTLYGQTTPYVAAQAKLARAAVEESGKGLDAACAAMVAGPSADAIKGMADVQVALERAAELLGAEPAPRALSPIVYDAKSKLFVLFGGDHLDYMTNDTWVFDPATKQWRQRHPKTAPPPRANHTLTATGDGKVKLSGGFCHNNTDIWYMGSLYQFLDDGDWTYDIEANTWTSDAGNAGVDSGQRAYRGMVFTPEAFMKGAKPDAAANEAMLKALPANTWTVMKPPVKPRVNRDWGSACVAADYDVLLRWSGGHCAHGGSDVPMYHFATNRWELPFPVEFPLGQCYSNTSYPNGFNFNRRPWVTGHTYKNTGYDPAGKVMVFTGHNPWSYIFDPKVADWTGRSKKPDVMNYGSSFYTLTLCTTDKGLYCWGGQRGNSNALHKWKPDAKAWEPVQVTGAKLPGPEVDQSGLVFDAKRDRLIFFPKTYKGSLFAMDCKTNELTELKPGGANDAAKTVGLWREQAYVPDADVVLQVGISVAGADKDAPRLSLAYDCASNEWRTLAIGGSHPAGKAGRDVSCGSGYDAKRKLIWATDTNSEVYVLRLDMKTANGQR